MTTYSYPGVYMEEVSSGVRPIEAAGTSTAAFFGVAESGPIGEAKKIFNFTEFQNNYGGFPEGYFMAHAVYQFFKNGGSQCYIGRIAHNADTASVTVQDRGGEPQNSLTFSAKSAGLWGNKLQVIVNSAEAEDGDNQFNLTVFREDSDPDAPPTALESFANLCMNPSSPNYVETAVNSRSKNIRIDVNKVNSNTINGYSESGEITLGGDLLGADQRKFRINIHGDGYQTVDLTSGLTGVDMTDIGAVAGGIQKAIRAREPQKGSTPEDAFTVTVTVEGTNKLRITSGHKSADSKIEILNAENVLEDAAGALLLGKRNGGAEIFGASLLRPRDTPADDYYLLGDDTVEGFVTAVEAGTDGTLPLQDQDYIDAFNWLDTIRDVSLIAVPGIGSTAVVDEGMNYCLNRPLMDCFYIADMAREDIALEDAEGFRDSINVPNSYGAVYFPWLKMLDPLGVSSEPIQAPPSGFIAGLYSRIDAKRGVWKAPAGTEAMLAGAVGLVTELTDTQQGNLNTHTKSVCVLRKFPGSGLISWGARTLSSDPEYKYIPVRRMAIMLRVSIFNGIQWAVFEPNDEDLWSQLRMNIGSFMMTLFRKGAFQGSKPSEAFFVKCDAETTTQDDIDLGVVNILIGFAPLKPAEFVVVKISQMAGEAS